MSVYDLSDLGWLLFERLASDVAAHELGIPPSAWQGASDGQREAQWDAPLASLGLDRPSVVRMVWVSRACSGRDAVSRRLDEARGARGGPAVVLSGRPRRVPVLLTNLDEPDVPDGRAVHVLGRRWLSAVLEREGSLRIRHPAALGVRAGGASLSRRTASFDVASATDLARAFVPVGAYARVRSVLERHHFAVLTGPPEMGKTATARMLALALATDGWEAHECLRPEDVWTAWDEGSAQLFVADDAFGSTEYRPDAAERWAREMERLLRRLDERHWLVWTSRPAPLRAGLDRIHRERGAERFPRPGEVLVDAAALELSEKALILFRHAQAAGASGTTAARLVREHGDLVVEDPHFTPERIRRLAGGRLFRLDGAPGEREAVRAVLREELREPTAAMAASFGALDPDYRAVLVAMLDCPPGPVAERDLAAAARRQADGGLPRAPADVVDRLADHFLRIVDSRIAWVHPSWRDLVIDQLTGDAPGRRAFLERAGLDGVLLGLSVGGGRRGERAFPLLVDDRDWDLLGDRLATLARQSDAHDVLRVLLAISAAFAASPVRGERIELQALAGTVLGAIARSWERAARSVPVGSLAAWLELAGWTSDQAVVPQLDRTWFALLPRADDSPTTEDLRSADDWLWLVQVLGEHRPGELLRLGFPASHVARLRALVSATDPAREDDDPGYRQLAESVRHRRAWIPLPFELRPAPRAERVAARESIDGDEPSPTSVAEPAPAGLVERILRDL